jgi:signal transduction histidine kinase
VNDRIPRVLLVEDDEDDYLIVRDLLGEAGIDASVLAWVTDYERGLAAVVAGDYDVALVDHGLGPRTGIDLLREARARGCHRPLILLTGQGDRQTDLAAMEAGATDYLVKGRFEAATLERMIRYAIEAQRLNDELRKSRDELERRVTERTAELERANRALLEADRRKDEFLAILGHELRNPLAPIRMALHVLDHDSAPAEALARAREILDQQVTQMTRLVDDLMDVSRVALGKISLERRSVDLGELVDGAVDGARPALSERNHRFDVALPEKPVLLEVDPDRIRQVLLNLLINAAKYTEPGGSVRLTVNAVDGSGDVVFRIEDSGRGMTEEERSRIFVPFVQGEHTLDLSEGGIGIGLTLARRLIEMHDGSIQAESPGRGLGSAFEVRLPRRTL